MWYLLRGMSKGQYLLLLILRSAAGCGRQVFCCCSLFVCLHCFGTGRKSRYSEVEVASSLDPLSKQASLLDLGSGLWRPDSHLQCKLIPLKHHSPHAERDDSLMPASAAVDSEHMRENRLVPALQYNMSSPAAGGD